MKRQLFELGIPVLGYLLWCTAYDAYTLGGKVATAPVSEYGKTEVLVDKTDFHAFRRCMQRQTICWMSHTDYISQEAPEGFEYYSPYSRLPCCS